MTAPARKRKQQPKPPAPEPAVRVRDEIGELLIAQGFVANEFLLELNHGLTATEDTRTEPPWNLPSRVFQFPVEIGDLGADGKREVGLTHPELAEHPFVQRVQAALGFAIASSGAPNRSGYRPRSSIAPWWHSVDLIAAGLWRELIATRRFTTDTDILGGVSYGLDYGMLKPVEARELLTRHLGVAEPPDREATLGLLMEPHECKPDHGSAYWPINRRFGDDRRGDPGAVTWGRVYGIEAGWFTRQGRHLQWGAAGRALYAAVTGGNGAVAKVEDKNGQFGFVL